MARSDMYRKLPWKGGNPREVSEVVNNLVEGKSNNTSTVILNTSGTETTVFNERVGLNSVILFVPRSANAAGETDHIFIKTKFKGSFIIGHRNHGHSDVELDYIVVG
jgi:hypothetical protein